MSGYRFRIAPTPSGFLHAGNAFNFILTWLLAHEAGASLRLRIDDADAPRVRPQYLEDIFETLAWLGLDWDEGPRSAKDHAQHFSQSLRSARYSETIEALIATGYVFACNCSRKDILAVSSDGRYPGTCRAKELPLDTPNSSLRLYTPRESAVSFTDALLGPVKHYPFDETRDPVIRRRDGLPAYHLTSLTDDLDYGTTHVVRGQDLLSSTIAQLFISHTLGGIAFDTTMFYHHPLLRDASGAKLSKSAGSASLQSRRQRGESVEEVYRHFSHFMWWPYEVADSRGASEAFAQFGLNEMRRAIRSRG